MLRGWRSVRRVPCVYPVLSVVWLLSPSIFLILSISASAPSNIGFFSSPKSARVGIGMNATQTRCTYSGRFSLCLPSLPLHVSLYIPPVLLLPRGVSSIGSSFFPILAGFGGYPALLCFCYCYCFRLSFFFCFGGVLASGDARVLEPLRDTSVISKLGLGHSPCSGEGDSGGESGFSIYLFSAVVRLVCC